MIRLKVLRRVCDKLFVFKHCHVRLRSAKWRVFTLLHFMKGIQFWFDVSQTLIKDAFSILIHWHLSFSRDQYQGTKRMYGNHSDSCFSSVSLKTSSVFFVVCLFCFLSYVCLFKISPTPDWGTILFILYSAPHWIICTFIMQPWVNAA